MTFQFEKHTFALPDIRGLDILDLTPPELRKAFFAIPENNRPIAHKKKRGAISAAYQRLLFRAKQQGFVDDMRPLQDKFKEGWARCSPDQESVDIKPDLKRSFDSGDHSFRDVIVHAPGGVPSPAVGHLSDDPAPPHATYAPRKRQQHRLLGRKRRMPGPTTLPLSSFTLSTFYCLFYEENPSARDPVPWESVLDMYRKYVWLHWGCNQDTTRHISEAYLRTKLQIPPHITEEYLERLAREDMSRRRQASDLPDGNATGGTEPHQQPRPLDLDGRRSDVADTDKGLRTEPGPIRGPSVSTAFDRGGKPSTGMDLLSLLGLSSSSLSSANQVLPTASNGKGFRPRGYRENEMWPATAGASKKPTATPVFIHSPSIGMGDCMQVAAATRSATPSVPEPLSAHVVRLQVLMKSALMALDGLDGTKAPEALLRGALGELAMLERAVQQVGTSPGGDSQVASSLEQAGFQLKGRMDG